MSALSTVRPRWSRSVPKCLKSKGGFTFIEIMVTLVVLSVGIVGVYQALFKSLDHMNRLNSRIYANIMLEDQIATIERQLRAYKTLPMELPPVEDVNVGSKTIRFEPALRIGEVDQFTDVFKIDLVYRWTDGGRQTHLGRSAYLSDFLIDENNP